jgi:sigma-E factor negative regulatory protein RseA
VSNIPVNPVQQAARIRFHEDVESTFVCDAMNISTTQATRPETGELLSALADDQLSADELNTLLSDARGAAVSATVLASWTSYQLIGDLLRSPSNALGGKDADFMAEFSRRLALEPIALAKSPFVADLANQAEPKIRSLSAPRDAFNGRADAANDGNFRWKMLAGLASLAAVSVVGWSAVGWLTPAGSPQLAQAPAPAVVAAQQVLVTSSQGPVVRDARLEELLAAHRQMGGTSALQVPSGFLRNATFEAPQGAAR